MLNITKGASNELTVTATEYNIGEDAVESPTWLFYFVSANNKKSAFILTNTSTHTSRYDTFTFTEGSTTAKTLEAGSYKYYIYAQTSTTNLDPDLADKLCEQGIAYVSRTMAEPESHEIDITVKSHVIANGI